MDLIESTCNNIPQMIEKMDVCLASLWFMPLSPLIHLNIFNHITGDLQYSAYTSICDTFHIAIFIKVYKIYPDIDNCLTVL